MSHLNRALIQRIPAQYQESIGYYPDILFYQHDSIQYRNKLRRLAEASYLYTDGYGIKTAGFFRYFLESAKGWFGYTNHCQQEKTQLSLYKFAFYGYLRGYRQPKADLRALGLTNDFINLVSQPRTNQNSMAIQQMLINHYVENEFAMNTSSDGRPPQVSQRYAYGSILQYLGFWSELPNLDPQNDTLITNTFLRLEPESGATQVYNFLPASKYASAVANSYLERAKQEKSTFLYGWSLFTNSQSKAQQFLERAVLFDPTISLREKNLYIEYFLEKKDLATAFTIIEQLDNPEQAFKYIQDGKYSHEHLSQWVKKDSWLASVLSATYLHNNYNIQLIQLTTTFHNNFAERYPVHAFRLMISQDRFDEAYELFKTNKNQAFLEQDMAKLANHFDVLGEQLYQQGHPHRLSKTWTIAKDLYLKSAAAKRKAYELQPDNEDLREGYFRHKRLYAQLIISADKSNNSAENCEITEIVKAVKFLEECQPQTSNEQQFQKKALAQGLMRQVDYLTTHILTPVGYGDFDSRQNHHQEQKQNFEHLTTALKRIINLLADTRNSELKLILGKAYFLLADLSNYFDLPDYNPQYFTKAREAVPDNPFYLLRCAEIFPKEASKLRNPAIAGLKQLGFSVMDWYHWDTERWQKDYRVSPIRDIHYQQHEDNVIGLQLAA